jgi:hypothetical protein
MFAITMHDALSTLRDTCLPVVTVLVLIITITIPAGVMRFG